MAKLNERQHRFCYEYLVDGNATEAYKRAGYKVTTDEAARANAARLLASDNVAAKVKELRRENARRCDVDARWVLRALLRNHKAAVKLKRLTDSNRALELVGKAIGMFIEKVEHKGKLALAVVERLIDATPGNTHDPNGVPPRLPEI